ncbi:MAG TPA: arylsulfatase [Sphingobacteriaceae bacterium]|nr:arylsulfatase [Sphingobacteriaceae bacterium]
MKQKKVAVIKRIFLIGVTIASLSYTIDAQPAAKGDKQPNIVLIMADDLGYSDIGCYGGEIKTPNLDKLAKNGLRFSQFYNASRCCPTRASLLTGLYSHQAGMGNMSSDQGTPGYRGYLTENTVTLAEVLKTAGYQTGMIGKWHLSNTPTQSTKENHLAWLNHQADYPIFAPVNQYPVNRGFDKFYGTIWGVVNFFDPFSLVNGKEPVKSVDKDYYYTDAINDSASNYVRQFSKNKAPFFLYVAHAAPHWPLHALPEDIKKYKEVYKAGWDVIRNARYKKMIREGLFDPKQDNLSQRWHEERKWDENRDKEWDAYAMAVRAAMVDRMDRGIGKIIQTLKETGQLDNTLILFLSDNGASSDDAQNYGPGFDRPGKTRTGETITYPVKKQVLPGPETTFASTNEMWSNVANTPFRYWKTKAFEGGICTPLIVSWPKGLSAVKGSVTNQTGHVIDLMSTFSELAGAKYPEIYKDNLITPTEGLSLIPIFKGQQRKGHEYLFFEHLNSKAVRYGDWKLVSLNDKSGWELYNLKSDRTEMNNLAKQNPELVKKLETKWQEWAHKSHVLPKPSAANIRE